MLDTPGILWPKFEDPEVGKKIACIGSIREETLDTYTLAGILLDYLRPEYQGLLQERYKLNEDELSQSAEELLLTIGAHRGYKVSGGRIDWERTARVILDEFRDGKIGRITLETPEETYTNGEENKGGTASTVS